MHLIVEIKGQGYGYMPAQDYRALPPNVMDRVEVLAACETEDKARRIYEHLPRGWENKLLAYRGDASAVEVVIVVRRNNDG